MICIHTIGISLSLSGIVYFKILALGAKELFIRVPEFLFGCFMRLI